MKYKPKFNIGDIVEVVDIGKMYTRYDRAAQRMKLRKWGPDERPKKGEQVEVVAIIPHPSNHLEDDKETIKTLLGVRVHGGFEVVIGQDGCVLTKKYIPNILPEELFTI